MIYFDENFKKLTIPVSSDKKIAKIRLVNQAEEYDFTNFTVGYDKKHYVTVTFTSKVEILPGQYDYKLLDSNDDMFDTGILQYGDYQHTNDEYDTNIDYIVYG